MMMMKSKQLLTAFLLLAVGVVFGQDAGGEGVCECGEVTQLHQKCVSDWSALDELRKALEQQVRDTEVQANERCNVQIEQVRGEVEQVRSEENRRMQLVRSESQAELEGVKRKAEEDLSQCQTQHKELNSHFEEQGNTHRLLQESSQQLEQALAGLKSEKAKLEKTVSERDLTLNKVNKDKMASERELKETKKTLQEMIAAKTIIAIDWDLLNEKIEELKAQAQGHMKDFGAYVGEQLDFVKGKMLEFYNYLETEVYPTIKSTIEKDVVPFLKKSWKQAQTVWEDLYSPYRPTVNTQIEAAKTKSQEFYSQNLEPHVKEYGLDVHAANAKKTADEYATLAHNNLVQGVKTSSGVALNFVKLEEGPDFAVNALEKLHANYESVAYYIECFLAFLVVYYIVIPFFFGKKKKRKGGKSKKQMWQEKEAAKSKGQSPKKGTKNGMKNGHKNTKKNK